MLGFLKVAAAFAAAAAVAATYVTLGHIQLPVTSAAHRAPAQRPGSTSVENVAGEFATTVPPLPMPTATPAATPGPSADTPDQGAGQQAAPPARRNLPPPPAIVVGSAQQAYINSDRAAAGLPPLTWSSCLAGIAAGQSQAMAQRGYIFHGSGVNQDFGCGLGTQQTGENVGYWTGGINDAQLNTMFMNSAEHRANIMGPYRYVGTAWVVAPNGYGYLSVEFA